jgi:hypothetical protein
MTEDKGKIIIIPTDKDRIRTFERRVPKLKAEIRRLKAKVARLEESNTASARFFTDCVTSLTSLE